MSQGPKNPIENVPGGPIKSFLDGKTLTELARPKGVEPTLQLEGKDFVIKGYAVPGGQQANVTIQMIVPVDVGGPRMSLQTVECPLFLDEEKLRNLTEGLAKLYKQVFGLRNF